MYSVAKPKWHCLRLSMVLIPSISASNRVFEFESVTSSPCSIIGNKSDLCEDIRLVILLSIHLMLRWCEIVNAFKLSHYPVMKQIDLCLKSLTNQAGAERKSISTKCFRRPFLLLFFIFYVPLTSKLPVTYCACEGKWEKLASCIISKMF